MSCLWNALSMKCPVYEMSCLWNILSMKWSINIMSNSEMSCLWNILSMKWSINIMSNSEMSVYEMSCLWNILSMKYTVYEIYCLWNILSMKWSINEMSNCEMSVYEMTQHHMMCLEKPKDVMQGKLFQCTHLLYCSVLSLGGNVNTRRMLQPDMGSIFHIKKSMTYSVHRKVLCELSKFSNLMLLTSSDTKWTLMHLFLFTNSAQRELVSICTQSIQDRN